MIRRLLFWLYRKGRVLKFRLLSDQAPLGQLHRVQAVQIVGAGTVKALGSVYIGYFPSPHFFSTYSYLEARQSGAQIEIGDNTRINNGFVAISEQSSIRIGKNCLIGTRVEIYDSDFHTLSIEDRRKGAIHEARPVRIGNDVFIGSNVRILKGVIIGDGSVIANGSLVTRDIPANCIASGIPAAVIRTL